MKLLLTSAGLTTPEIIKAYEKLVGKKCANINIIAIKDAFELEQGDLSWQQEEEAHLQSNSKSITTLSLQTSSLEEVREQIASADAIYCFGGDADHLMQVFERTGFDKILPEILEEKVWIGSSAGSCILCHKESEITSKEVFQKTPIIDHYLNLVPAVIMPHYHGWFKFDKAEIDREAKDSKYPVYALSDQSALEVTKVTKITKGSKGNKNKIEFTLETIGEDYELRLGKEFNDAVDQTFDAASNALKNLFRHKS